MQAIYFPIIVTLLLLPMIVRGLRNGRPLSFVLVVMIAYGMISIGTAKTETANIQYLLLTVAVIGLVIGRYFIWFPNRQSKLFKPTTRPRFNTTIHPKRLYLLLAVGLVFSGYLFATHGIPLFSGDTMNSRLDILANGYLGTLAVAPLDVGLIAILMSINVKRDSKKLTAIKLMAGLAVFGILWLYGNRGMAVFPLLAIGAYFLIKYPKHIFRVLLVSVGVIALVGYAGYSRNYEAWGIAYESDLLNQGFNDYTKYMAPVIQYSNGTSEAMDIILGSIPDKVAYPMGAIFFSALLSPLPGAQQTAGGFLKELAGAQFDGGGLAMGSIGGFYMDFGPLGVIIGFIVFGIIFGMIERRALSNGRWTLVLAWLSGHLILMNYSHPLPNIAIISAPFLLYWVMKETPMHKKSWKGSYENTN